MEEQSQMTNIIHQLCDSVLPTLHTVTCFLARSKEIRPLSSVLAFMLALCHWGRQAATAIAPNHA